MSKSVFDEKVNIEITLGELEELIVMLRVANKFITGKTRSELEEKLENMATKLKMAL